MLEKLSRRLFFRESAVAVLAVPVASKVIADTAAVPMPPPPSLGSPSLPLAIDKCYDTHPINIYDGGCGYSFPPTVEIHCCGSGGSGAKVSVPPDGHALRIGELNYVPPTADKPYSSYEGTFVMPDNLLH